MPSERNAYVRIKSILMLQYMKRGVHVGTNSYHTGMPRWNWEFLAVVRGRIRPVYPHQTAASFATKRLWILPPESSHAWAAPPASNCQVYVFHFAGILQLLESTLPATRTVSIPLNGADEQVLSSIYDEMVPHYQAPRLSSSACFEAAMLRLCSLFLPRDHDVADLAAFDAGAEKVLRALRWHRTHLADGVGVSEVAAAINVSPGHLRRLFMDIRQESPKSAFTRAMMEEACRLLTQGSLSLKEIGVRCGFSGFSEFYRAFRNITGQSPSAWRRDGFRRGFAINPSGAAALESPRWIRDEESAKSMSKCDSHDFGKDVQRIRTARSA